MAVDHKLMPKHGEHVNIAEVKAKPSILHIVKLQQDASLALSELLGNILISDKDRMVLIPCKQCLRDIALQFSDLSEALRELAE